MSSLRFGVSATRDGDGGIVPPEVPMRLWATEICAEYSVTAPFLMPDHAGGMFHGLFGRALRATACPQEDRCSLGPCARPGACDWERLFTPPAPAPLPHRLLAGMKEPPGPVVLLIPPPGGVRFSDAPKARPLDKKQHGQAVSTNERVSVGLRLFGAPSASDVGLLDRTLTAIAGLPFGTGKGAVTLRSITRVSPVEIVIEPQVAGAAAPRAEDRGATGRLTVIFETPARIKRGGKIVEEVDFPTLFAQVWRRLTLLGALHGQYGDSDDATFRRLRDLAATVRTAERDLEMHDWTHFSAETSEEKPMHGFVGHAVFEGEHIGELLPVLAAGELTHVGGGTSFGLGRIAVRS